MIKLKSILNELTNNIDLSLIDIKLRGRVKKLLKHKYDIDDSISSLYDIINTGKIVKKEKLNKQPSKKYIAKLDDFKYDKYISSLKNKFNYILYFEDNSYIEVSKIIYDIVLMSNKKTQNIRKDKDFMLLFNVKTNKIAIEIVKNYLLNIKKQFGNDEYEELLNDVSLLNDYMLEDNIYDSYNYNKEIAIKWLKNNLMYFN
jgi:hypothetical protein